MKAQDIKIKMEKFYNAELSADEENALIETVLKSDDPDFQELKNYLLTLQKLGKEEMSDNDFDDKLIGLLEDTSPIPKSKSLNWRPLSTVAASVIVIISLWFLADIIGTKEVYGTISDPEIAFSEAKQALQKVSKNVNKGVTPASKSIDKVDNGIKKTENVKKASKAIKNINKINKLNEPGQLLKSMSKVTVKAG